MMFVPFGTPVFGPKLRLPKLRLSLNERTYVRLGWLCSRTVLPGILPCPLLRGTKANNSSVVGVEVPSSQALALTGPNLGAQSLEISTAGNGTGSSSQPSCQKAPDNCSGASRRRSRSPLEVSEHLAVVHDDRRHGSRARSRRSHRSRSGSTRLPRAYRVRSRSRSCRSTKSHRSSSLTSSAGSERSLGGSRAYSPRVHGSRARRSHSRRSRRDGTRSPCSKRSRYRSRQHRRSRSSRRPRSRHHGSGSYIREKS